MLWPLHTHYLQKSIVMPVVAQVFIGASSALLLRVCPWISRHLVSVLVHMVSCYLWLIMPCNKCSAFLCSDHLLTTLDVLVRWEWERICRRVLKSARSVFPMPYLLKQWSLTFRKHWPCSRSDSKPFALIPFLYPSVVLWETVSTFLSFLFSVLEVKPLSAFELSYIPSPILFGTGCC